MIPIDIERARSDTPGCKNVVHLNNAGASLPPHPVLDAMVEYLYLEASIGGYEAAQQQAHRIRYVYDLLAQLIGAQPEDMAVLGSATAAWDLALASIPLQAGDVILMSAAEYASNVIAALQITKHRGAELQFIPNDSGGQVSLQKLDDLLSDRVKVVAITHVPTNGGLINPAEEIGALIDGRALYLLDACQSIGQMPVDVRSIRCDLLSATGRKFLRGPRGMGFLYIRPDLAMPLEPPFLDLHGAHWSSRYAYESRKDARRFEHWERNYAAQLGLGEAAGYALEWGLDAIQSRNQELAQKLRKKLSAISGVALHDLGPKQCGIVSLTLQGKSPAQIKTTLAHKGINVSVSNLSSTRIDMEERNLDSLLRASVHYYNTEEELDRFCEELAQLAPQPP